MKTTPEPARRCTVYAPHDKHETHSLPGNPRTGIDSARADQASLQSIMTQDLVCTRSDFEVSCVAELMSKHQVGCLPVVDERLHPIGIITRSDLVDHLDFTVHKSSEKTWTRPSTPPRIAADVMMPLAFTMPDTSSVAHAAATMVREGTHHLVVVDADGTLAGLVSAMDVVGWVASHYAASGDTSVGPPVWTARESPSM